MWREHYKNNSSCLETSCPLVTLLEGLWSKTTLVMGQTQEKVLGGPWRCSLMIWLDSVGQCPAPKRQPESMVQQTFHGGQEAHAP